MSQLVSELYEYNTTLTAIFSRTYGEDTLKCPHKDYSSLIGGKLIRIYFLQFTFCNDALTTR
jgi:hypothetical protein